jgi:hypothetical protein
VHIRRQADWPAGLDVDRTPQCPSARQQLTIAAPSNFSEPFKPKPAGFAHPRPERDLLAQTRRRFVVDLVAQHHPADAPLRLRAGNGAPMRCGNLLDPPQVNGIVYMILLVDVFGQNRDSDFKKSSGHSAQSGAEKQQTFNVQRSTPNAQRADA